MVIDPQYKEAKVIRATIAEYDKALVASNDVKTQKNKLDEDYKRILLIDGGKAVPKMRKMIPQRIETIKFILDMSDMSRQRGLLLKNLTISGAGGAATKDSKVAAIPRSQAYKTNSFSFSVSTSYEKFLSFLQALEQNLQVMDITSITFTSSDSSIYDFSISGNVYSLE
jgi:hypothetical protein